MRISRKEMEAIIDSGESVIIDGQVIWEKDKLPTEAALAKGNKDAEKAAKKSLLAQMEGLKAQMALLDEGTDELQPAVEDAPAEDDFNKISAKEKEDREAAELAAAEETLKAEKARKAEEEKKAEAAKKEEAKK